MTRYDPYQVYIGDCLKKLDEVKDKSIQLECIDPPYNINKAEWDVIPNYVEWMNSIIEKLEKKLKDNGSLFIFHNDIIQISELIVKVKNNPKLKNLKLNQMITWNKRFDGSKKKGYLDGYVVKGDLHIWNKMCEYILFYTKDNTYKLLKERVKKGISQLTIGKEIKSKTGGFTGWYSNIETGRNLPTRDTIKPITKHLGLKYEDIVPKFNNLKTHHSVWNYDMAKRCKIHITPKPLELLKNIILHCSDEGDLCLDCFAGSGSFGIACLQTNRKVILIEKDEKYGEYINEKMKEIYKEGEKEAEVVEEEKVVDEEKVEDINEKLDKKTKKELIKYCKENKIKGYSKKRKLDIIKLIETYKKLKK